MCRSHLVDGGRVPSPANAQNREVRAPRLPKQAYALRARRLARPPVSTASSISNVLR